jgi:hypothetical protein
MTMVVQWYALPDHGLGSITAGANFAMLFFDIAILLVDC